VIVQVPDTARRLRGQAAARGRRWLAAAVAPRLERDGFETLRGVIPHYAIERALRCLHLDLLHRGLSASEIAAWHEAKCWFPHLRWHPEILGLLEHLRPGLRQGTPCEPQILLQLPDEADNWPLEPHVDEPPPWAHGRRYRTIVGVALTPNRRINGGLVVWPFRGGRVPVVLAAGDVVLMDPALGHSGGLNREGGIRYVVYFRFLDD
jgi:hypothetical protein